MPTVLFDVAKKAGVSISTASLALRGMPKVSDKTRQKVWQAARDLSFAINASARTLASGRSDVLAVAVHELSYLGNPYIGGIIGGVAEVSDKNGFSLMFARSSHSGTEEPEYLRITREGRVDGTIFIDQDMSIRKLQEYANVNVPSVLVDRDIPGNKFPVIRIDYRKAVAEATSYLISLGHRRIAVVTPNVKMFEYEQKFAGYKEALAECGLEYDCNLLKSGDEPTFGEQRLKAIVEDLTNMSEHPTAYLCLQDIRTMPLCEILRMHDFRIPEDISVVGFESGRVEDSGLFSIGVIKVPVREAGMRACQLLMDLFSGHTATKKVVLDAVFEPRNSCRPPAGE